MNNEKNIIPVVFASDENYAMPLAVTIVSMLENKNVDTYYDIYVLIDKEFSNETKNKIFALQNKYFDCKIKFIVVGNTFDNASLSIKHITKVTYYRLIIPTLLPHLNKCLYLDVDIIVQKDLRELYDIDVEGYYIAGVKAPSYQINPEYHADRLKIDTVDCYVNAGVLLINLYELRNNKLEFRFMQFLKEKFRNQDQDIINVACVDKIKSIDFRYNLMTKYVNYIKNYQKKNNITYDNSLNITFSHNEIINAVKDNVIIHYLTKVKPWHGENSVFSNIWWSYFKISPYKDDIRYKIKLEIIPIVFLCEDTDIQSLSVSLVSLLENANITTFYNIVILHQNLYSKENIIEIEKISNSYKECSISFNMINFKDNTVLADLILNNITNIDKCIYLSHNIVVQNDLSELYNQITNNSTISAVKKVDGQYCENVLLINIDNYMKSKSKSSFEYTDLELKFNLNSNDFYEEKNFNFSDKIRLNPKLLKIFQNQELKSALSENIIFSYDEDNSPFKSSMSSFYYNWFKYFRLSPLSKRKKEMVEMPKVSVIIPVYNVSKYVCECLDSIINQTLEEIEIICIDDGSTDNTIELIREYTEFDKRIAILKQENQGAGAARNLGLSIAKGEYLSFLDPDDFFEPTMLEQAYQKAIKNDVDIVVFNYMTYDQNKNKFSDINHILPTDKEVFSYEDIPNVMFNSLHNNAWTKLYKRSFIEKNDIKFQHLFRVNDIFFTNTAAVIADKITFLDKKLVYYRIGMKDNSQSTLYKYPLSFYEAQLAIRNRLKDVNKYDLVEKAFLDSLIRVATYNLNRVKDVEAMKIMYNHIKENVEKDFNISKYPRDYYITQLFDELTLILNTPFEGYMAIKGKKIDYI